MLNYSILDQLAFISTLHDFLRFRLHSYKNNKYREGREGNNLIGFGVRIKSNNSFKVSQLLTLYQQNRLQAQHKMGLECAKANTYHFAHHHHHVEQLFDSQMSKIKDVATFEIKINNLRLLNFHKNFENITILLSNAFRIVIPFKDFVFQNHILISKRAYSINFEASIQSLTNKYVEFIMESGGKAIEILRIKVNQLFRGPVRHDHLLKQLKSRFIFDFHIQQYLHSDIHLKHCEIQWGDAKHHTDYTYFLSLIFSNSRHPIQNSKVFQKHEKIKEVVLNNIFLRSSELHDAILRIRVIDNLTEQSVLEYLLPFTKLRQKASFKRVKEGDKDLECRQITIDEKIAVQERQSGSIKLELKILQSRLYADQLDCFIMTENGIVMHTLSEEGKVKDIKQLSLEKIAAYMDQLQQFKNGKYSSYSLYLLIQKIYVEIQDKNVTISDQLFPKQEALLNFLILISSFISIQKSLANNYIWDIINYICRLPILTLKYFCGIHNDESKIIFAKKIYAFIIAVIKKIIKLTSCNLSYEELKHIHKFIAFAYFRLPWCQDQLTTRLHRSNDPVLTEEKLAEIGASYALRSPSKSYFYDWDATILSLIKKDPELVRDMNELKKIQQQHKNWVNLLFDREYQQLFYGIYSELWDQAQSFLNNNGKILWQYFPKYGELLSMFIGQINSSKIMDLSMEMTKCNMKLIKNEKLLTTFMMLIFPKTQLFETYCVIKCLNLIECYLSVILNSNKKLPYNFNYSYFYTGIKCILQSQHSYLLQKMLSILYKFYNLFGQEFKEIINNFIINKVFYKLFLHWSQDVRNIFHLLLIFKIYQQEANQNPQISIRKQKNIKAAAIETKLQYEHIILSLRQNLEYKIKRLSSTKNEVANQYYQKMKAKLKSRQSKYLKSVKQAEFQSAIDEFQQNFVSRKCSCFEKDPTISKRKWSGTEQWEPEIKDLNEQEAKYLYLSLREYDEAKKEMNPDERVEARSKMFQIEGEE